MLKGIMTAVRESLEASGIENVYTAFDNIPINRKGGIFTAVSVDTLEAKNPVFTEHMVYTPYTAEVRLTVISSAGGTLSELYDYFERYILPAAGRLASYKSALKKLAMKYDSNMGRYTMACIFSAKGMLTMERGGENE